MGSVDDDVNTYIDKLDDLTRSMIKSDTDSVTSSSDESTDSYDSHFTNDSDGSENTTTSTTTTTTVSDPETSDDESTIDYTPTWYYGYN